MFHWLVALKGCDISRSRSGLLHIGVSAFLSALGHCDEEKYTTHWLLQRPPWRHAQPRRKLNILQRAFFTELNQVWYWFTSLGAFYDNNGNLYSVCGFLVEEESPHTKRHLLGKTDPKTGGWTLTDFLNKIIFFRDTQFNLQFCGETEEVGWPCTLPRKGK